jgi:hypothetical protein
MKNQKQQSPVEWYASKIHTVVNNTTDALNHNDKELLEQAKEMEKEQNKNYLKEYFEWHKSMKFVSHKPEDIIEFNETYGGDK